jgi:glycine cleavage system aminomethyltransferase T
MRSSASRQADDPSAIVPVHQLDYRVVPSARWHKSPLFWKFRELGANAYSIYNHILYAVHFEHQTKDAEYWAIKNGVTLWDVSGESPTEVVGPDAIRLMDLATPRDMSSCAVGQCRYAVFCDDRGGILNDSVVVRLAPDHYWLCPADSDLHLWLKGLVVGMGLDATVRLTNVVGVQIQGPRSPEVLERLFGEAVRPLGYYRFMEAEMDGAVPVVVTRTGWTGEVGFEIFLRDPSMTDRFFAQVLAAGEPSGMIPAGPNHVRRVEAGILNYQADMSGEMNPFEVGLGWQVNLDKERFIGKDALAEIASRGVERRLVGLVVEGERPPIEFQEPWPVYDGEQVIGAATIVVFSPALVQNIGLAILPVRYTEPGTRLRTVRVPTDVASDVTVSSLPFVDPGKTIPKTALSA